MVVNLIHGMLFAKQPTLTYTGIAFSLARGLASDMFMSD
jgi:hypothetical protein